jgi:hypothetical protein
MAKPYSKSQSLTGSYVALEGGYTSGITLINNSGVAVNYKLNDGDAIVLANGSPIYIPEVVDTSEVKISAASGSLGYIVYKN